MRKQIQIFVISLAAARARRESISAHLKSLGLSFEIIDAVDGRTMTEEERAALTAPGLTYHPGVIGCYISHINVYRHVVDRKLPLALILEDDARLDPDFAEALKDGICHTDFDYCLLDCEDNTEGNPVFFDAGSKVAIAAGFYAYETNIGPALLHAYLISNVGASRRLKEAFPIKAPVDVHSRLSYGPKFLAILYPKAASVSEYSRQSFTSMRNDTSPLRFQWLRRYRIYSTLREWATLKPIVGYMRAWTLVRKGDLASGRKWRPLPSGRVIHFTEP